MEEQKEFVPIKSVAGQTQEHKTIKNEDIDKYTKIYYIQDIKKALKFNQYNTQTLSLIFYLLQNNKNKVCRDPIKVTNCSEETLRQKAAVLGYTVKCDQQEIIGGEKLFADEGHTIKFIGYDLFKNGVPIDGIYRAGEIAPRMSLPDLERELRELYREKGLEWKATKKTKEDVDQRIEDAKKQYYKDGIQRVLEAEDRLSTLSAAYYILTKE